MRIKLLLDEDVQVELSRALKARDFVELHREFIIEGKEHHGIIVSRQLPIGAALKRLLSLMNTLSAEDMRNRFEFLSDWKEERNSFCL